MTFGVYMWLQNTVEKEEESISLSSSCYSPPSTGLAICCRQSAKYPGEDILNYFATYLIDIIWWNNETPATNQFYKPQLVPRALRRVSLRNLDALNDLEREVQRSAWLAWKRLACTVHTLTLAA